MADRPEPAMEPEDPALAIAARHALHDEELIAAFATDGDAADDPQRARGLIERCTTCRDLHADIVALGGALQATAGALGSSQRAPRDFRLSVETANRLRPGSVVLRLGDRIRDALAGFGRPLGMSMASLGVVGLLLGTVTLGGAGSPAAAPEDMGGTAGGAPSAAAGYEGTPPTGEVQGPASFPRETVRLSTLQIDASNAPATAAPTTGMRATDELAATPDLPPTGAGQAVGGGTMWAAVLLVGSASLLIGGIALLLLTPRRRRELVPGP